MLILSILSLILGLQPLHDAGYKGQGVKVAVIDCGFYGAFNAGIFNQERIIGSYDLLKQDSVHREGMFDNPSDNHGAHCLSLMLAQNDVFTGTAPEADYILIRTEDLQYEYLGELDRLERGFQLAEELGADIVTVSLGYTVFDGGTGNFTYEDMNGKSSVSKKATQLMHNNILVCVAAGNEGNKPWYYIDIPADAEDILTVGATTADSLHASFSGYGPTSDGRLKPEVAAWGEATQMVSLTNGTLSTGNGTSFATPEIAGMAACLRQALPHLTALQIRDIIIRSASQYNNPDNLLGYGIPDAETALELGRQLTTSVGNECLSDEQKRADTEVRKIFHKGRLYIIRGGVWYTPTGNKKG